MIFRQTVSFLVDHGIPLSITRLLLSFSRGRRSWTRVWFTTSFHFKHQRSVQTTAACIGDWISSDGNGSYLASIVVVAALNYIMLDCAAAVAHPQ